MRIILVRHGKTDMNAAKIIQGHLDGKLIEEGKEQARKAAAWLRHEKIDVIYSSDLSRARETAEIIAREHGLSVITDRRLRERNWGEAQGKPRHVLSKLISRGEMPSGAETDRELVERVKSFVDEMMERHNGTVAIVSHGGTLRALKKVITNDPRKIEDIERHSNTGITIIDVDELGHTIRVLNSTEHLK